MLRYLIKTLLQMNLFADSMLPDASNGTDLLFNLSSLPSFNASFLDLGNFTSFNAGAWRLQRAVSGKALSSPSTMQRLFVPLPPACDSPPMKPGNALSRHVSVSLPPLLSSSLHSCSGITSHPTMPQNDMAQVTAWLND
ncbi:hypothetical protein AAFF_G00416510 [Aldrovandia affinis]|uniref:Uncharacterized protein n=1 Tax=Aldrovandia affinis TaxID=143900 RepID=A0AAD7WK51_9TELE|nr:hypothetical protein AAFF_G00416510 [Aldrovandia affinis]